jgi:hypothetical protein
MVLAVLENVSRHDLTEAEVMTALRVLRDLKQWGSTEIARRLGVTRQWVNMFFRIADDAVLGEHVQAGRLSVAKAQEVRTARTPAACKAALTAALEGASLRRIREIARGDSASGGIPAGRGVDPNVESDFPDDAEDVASGRTRAAGAARGEGVRDIAVLADERGVKAHMHEFRVVNLILDLVKEKTDEIELAEFVRFMREDLRTARAKVLAAPRRRR